MKVWCFNCYGVCIKRMRVEDIPQWNAEHPLANQKITSWKEQKGVDKFNLMCYN